MKKFLVMLLVCTSVSSFGQYVNVIPQPLDVRVNDGFFEIGPKTAVKGESDDFNLQYLRSAIKERTGFEMAASGRKNNVIELKFTSDQELGDEGYKLEVSSDSIVISAPTNGGLFYGIQTLLQMIDNNEEKFVVSAVNITDKPRFSWRALMLDEARHFKGKDQVKKLLDQMAMLKMNIFHWHLTDDQGWRIEIKKYPLLTEIGGFRKGTQIGGWDSPENSGIPHGGYYTQEEIREVIQYARDRNITIVPEIEMPGHASAAIAAYPWLGTIGELKEVPMNFGKLDDSFNVTDDKVIGFLQDVLNEVIALFPGKVIHIGGDEVKFDAWKDSEEVQNFMTEKGLESPADLQIFFTNKISNYIDSKGDRMMGWNEIMGGNIHEWQKDEDFKGDQRLASSAIVHFWKGSTDLVTQAVSNGYDIVNSYHVFTYLDYSYKYIPIEKAYSFDPVPEGLDKQYEHKVLGSGCQMWSEWIPSVSDMDRQVFPRLAAYAEVGWTSRERKNYEKFRKNMDPILKIWREKGIEYSETFEKE